MPISLLFAATCGLVALGLGTRWVTGTKRHWILIPLLVVVGGPSGWFGWQRVQTERAATAAVQNLTGNSSVYAVCEGLWASLFSTGMYGGWVDYKQPNRANLSREICQDLRSYLNSDKVNPSDAQIIAVHVVTHETAHLPPYSIEVEQEAECWAVQHNQQTAELLGASPAAATALADRYAHVLYHRMRDSYRSRECVENGTMDLTPGDGHWP